jgi:primosomal protein N' (replication factor Y)
MSESSLSILQIVVDCPLRTQFDYLPPADCVLDTLQPGMRIRVSFGRRETIGLLVGIGTSSIYPAHKLKAALEILDTEPVLPPILLELARWASQYYHQPIGEVLLGVLPGLLRKGKPAEFSKRKSAPPKKDRENPTSTDQHIPTANSAQQEAIDAICASLNKFDTFLLDGVTGSGKTEVYLQAIDQVLKSGKQALVLVPEIGLTPQTVERFRQRFPVPIVTIHSGLTDRERLNAWLMAKNGDAKIIIGTRSALFTPLLNPGIIIIDEEHDLSFKQQEGFRYSARDLAIIRGRLENIPIVLGSATPALESLANVTQGRYRLLSLPERAGTAIHPTFHVVDLRNQPLIDGLFAKPLLNAIQKHLEQDNQVLLFLNRRGYAPVVMCHTCAWVASCSHCDSPLTLHSQPAHLQCHHCGAQSSPVHTCPTCKTKSLLTRGTGTQQIEESLTQHFPNSPLIRIDRDSTSRKGTFETALEEIHSGHRRIMIGTQMLAKGHHFPNVSLAVILNVDSGLYSTDFRATERLAQLLIQVAGRSGRAEKPGEVIIQTHRPDHPLLQKLIQQGYSEFAKAALKERQEAGWPPFGYLALFRAEAEEAKAATKFLEQISQEAKHIPNNHIQLLGPIPAPLERRAGRYRAQLLIQSTHRQPLQTFLGLLLTRVDKLKVHRQVRWSLDVDPVDLI